MAALAAAFFIAVSPALAQVFCAPRAELAEKLAEDYSETPRSYGLTNANDRVIELLTSEDGETWTLIITYPSGLSCMIVAGHSWSKAVPTLLKPTGLPV